MGDFLRATWQFWCLIATLLTCAGIIAGAVTRHQYLVGVQMELLRRELREHLARD